ncbi:MAG: ferritin-like domain-containing protein [bacterium]|nr:ferritin [Gammaproteobacteria bacterium]HIL98251.1 ferritin [Pseudomonadales bacterium]
MKKYREVEEQPQEIRYFDTQSTIDQNAVEEITEIFKTPLVSTYNWDYSIPDSRIKKIYNLGKELNWNVDVDLDWENGTISKDEFPSDEKYNPYVGFRPYDDLNHEQKVEFSWHRAGLSASGMLHGEQGALLVAAQLACCAPSYEAKLYAASQTFDEARHVEFFNKYIQKQVGVMYPVGAGLKSLLDKVLTDERWDLKFIGMQIVIEGLALAAFNTAKMQSSVPVHKKGLHFVIRDEARHVTFGINYLEEFVKRLSNEEREERALFAFQAATGMGGSRGNQTRFYEKYGWNKDEVKEHLRSSNLDRASQEFRTQLFGRIMPNLKRVGLLTDNVKPMWEALGVLDLQDLPSDGAINWEEMAKPLVYEEISDSVVNA